MAKRRPLYTVNMFVTARERDVVPSGAMRTFEGVPAEVVPTIDDEVWGLHEPEVVLKSPRRRIDVEHHVVDLYYVASHEDVTYLLVPPIDEQRVWQAYNRRK